MKMYKHLNLRLLGFSLGTTFVVPNGNLCFSQFVENQIVMVFRNFKNQENKKLGLGYGGILCRPSCEEAAFERTKPRGRPKSAPNCHRQGGKASILNFEQETWNGCFCMVF